MASLTWWTWIRTSSRHWWWTVKPGVLQSWGCKESDTTEQVNGTVSKLECFTHRSISENLASASVSNIINTKWKKGPSVKEAQCWISCLRVHLRTLRFLMPCKGMPPPTGNYQFTALPSSKASVSPRRVFTVLVHCKEYAGYENANLGLQSKWLFSTCES